MVIELAKCKRCGKSGLFLRTNSQGLCKDCAENDKLIKTDVKKYLYKTDASYRKATDELDHQDRLLKVALMLHHLAKSKWNNIFNREAFIKDIMPSIKKLKWAPEDADTLADMVSAQVKAKDYKESALTSKYSEYVKAHA